MSIDATRFEAWLRGAHLPVSSTGLARLAGVPRRTLANQRSRGRVDPTVVVAIARSSGLSPFESLTVASGLDLMSVRHPPTTTELLSQTAADDIFAELLRRTRKSYGVALAAVRLSEPPVEEGVRQWINAVDPGGLRAAVAQAAGVDSSTISAAITSGRLTLEVNALVAKFTDTDPATGLVAAGIITMEEAGWAPGDRETALSNLDDVGLLDLVSSRLTDLQRRVARRLNAHADDTRYWQVLG